MWKTILFVSIVVLLLAIMMAIREDKSKTATTDPSAPKNKTTNKPRDQRGAIKTYTKKPKPKPKTIKFFL